MALIRCHRPCLFHSEALLYGVRVMEALTMRLRAVCALLLLPCRGIPYLRLFLKYLIIEARCRPSQRFMARLLRLLFFACCFV